MSAATAKRGLPDLPREPRPGTHLRAVYDAFVNNPGLPIVPPLKPDIPHKSATALKGRHLVDLSDYYHLDIRLFRHHGNPKGRGLGAAEYVLVGRWHGSRYEDYVQEKAP